MKYKFLIIFGFAAIIFTSCENFINGVVREIELPETEPVLAPFLLLDEQDTAILVTISKTTGVLDSVEPTLITNATIELYRNGNLLHTINSDHYDIFNGFYSYDLGGQFGQELGLYEMKVRAAGYPEVSATQNMVLPVAIDSVGYIPNGYVDPLNGNKNELKLYFQDPPDVENYYMVSATATSRDTNPDGTPFYQYTAYLETQEPYIEQGWDNSVFSDETFDGQYISASFGTWNTLDFEQIVFRLISISKDTYTYIKSFNTYSNSIGNPFAEPSLLYSNTDGGLGFFGLSAGSEKEVEE